MSKLGQQGKLYPPTNISALLQCHPHLVLVKCEKLVYSISTKENSYFGVMHWQQWQPPASTPGSEFYNSQFLKYNNIEMYSTYNEGKSVVVERFIRTLKEKIFKHSAAISKNVYFDVLDDIVNKYNNTVHRTIKMKPIDVTNDSYVEYNKDFNKRDPKFKFGDHVRIPKYKNIFAKGYTPNLSEEVFVISKIKNTVPWT